MFMFIADFQICLLSFLHWKFNKAILITQLGPQQVVSRRFTWWKQISTCQEGFWLASSGWNALISALIYYLLYVIYYSRHCRTKVIIWHEKLLHKLLKCIELIKILVHIIRFGNVYSLYKYSGLTNLRIFLF